MSHLVAHLVRVCGWFSCAILHTLVGLVDTKWKKAIVRLFTVVDTVACVFVQLLGLSNNIMIHFKHNNNNYSIVGICV